MAAGEAPGRKRLSGQTDSQALSKYSCTHN